MPAPSRTNASHPWRGVGWSTLPGEAARPWESRQSPRPSRPSAILHYTFTFLATPPIAPCPPRVAPPFGSGFGHQLENQGLGIIYVEALHPQWIRRSEIDQLGIADYLCALSAEWRPNCLLLELHY